MRFERLTGLCNTANSPLSCRRNHIHLVPNVPLGTEANALPIRDWERDEKLFVFFRVLSGRLNIDSF